jgi:hypothetical protein
MPLSWNEIKDRALTFSKEWKQESSEDAEAKSFWDGFFNVFGVSRKRLASFEAPVKKLGDKQGFIDLFWKGVLIVEHKSRGKNLDRAHQQALDYFPGIKERDLPRYVLVSDFARLRFYDLEAATQHEFELKDLHKNVKHFGFIAGYRAQELRAEDPVNRKAAEQMGKLHDALKASGYTGHALELLLVRVLFCLFADDTGIFQPAQCWREWLETRTAEDGNDLGPLLARFFQVLNTAHEKRSNTLDEQLAQFPYVNGKLFEEQLPIADFNAAMREALLDACALDWSQVSPAIFGAMFQSIMDGKARRNLGAHYTSEANILKLIGPLFLDELRKEFYSIVGTPSPQPLPREGGGANTPLSPSGREAGREGARRPINRNKLFEFHKKLRTLTFLDPACGCGNFLVVAYRELRELELDVLRAAHTSGQLTLDVHSLIALDVDQFYGIEIEEFPAQIAQVALWLTDHQMNLKVGEEFGMYFARIPLKTSPHIVHGNALTTDWASVLPPERCSYVMGNPPFIGAKLMSDEQRANVETIFKGISGGGLLDFVAAWYVKAARYITGQKTRCAFVSTNSITQGEQVGVLWSWMLAQGIKIHFAHRTFRWSNEAKGVAAVHCVIAGFGHEDRADKIIYEYADIEGEAHAVKARNINPYLVDAPDVVLINREHPVCDSPEIGIGNKPIDGGNYLFTPDEKTEFVSVEPGAGKWLRRWIGADELLNNTERWFLWLGRCPPEELRKMPEAIKRVEAVRDFRLASKSPPTQKLARTPTQFHVENIPTKSILVIPRHSSERRAYVPFGYFGTDVLVGDACLCIADASMFHFGILSSILHMAWLRNVCGRIKSDFRYSAGIVYNNFPWPVDATDKQKQTIEQCAQVVLDARAQFPNSSLADLYDPLTMPPALSKAHQALDRAVDAAYGKKTFASDAERVAFLFEQYQKLTSLLPADKPAKRRRAKIT